MVSQWKAQRIIIDFSFSSHPHPFYLQFPSALLPKCVLDPDASYRFRQHHAAQAPAQAAGSNGLSPVSVHPGAQVFPPLVQWHRVSFFQYADSYSWCQGFEHAVTAAGMISLQICSGLIYYLIQVSAQTLPPWRDLLAYPVSGNLLLCPTDLTFLKL